MNKKTLSLLILSIVTIGIFSYGFKGEENGQKTRKITANDHYEFIAINQVFMWVSNNGDGSHDPRTDGNGFYWPGGLNATKSAIFEDGLIFAGKLGREIRMNGNTHRQGLQAGKILPDGTADDPNQDKYRVYKITKGWEGLPPGPERDARQKDYQEWPIEDGAPYIDVNGDNEPTPNVDLPKYEGDETLWYVANDLDQTRSTFTYGTLPIGLEFQTTIFGFKRTGALGDMVFKKYTIINKGKNTVNNMILGYWSDTDLGDANDDYTGCDTALSLGYTWNADNDDGTYGTPPPAIGYDFFQGPIVPSDNPLDTAKFLGEWRNTAFVNGQERTGIRNLPMTAFAYYINGSATYRDPAQGVATGSVEFYNYLQGLIWNGEPFIDPTTQQEVKFVLAGDPVAGTGWFEGGSGQPPGDRRHLMSSGPFTLAPNDTQEIVVGIIAAIGPDNVESITALKTKDLAAQKAYDADFELTPPPIQPPVSAVPENNSVTLWWTDESEDYIELDPLLGATINFSVNEWDTVVNLTPDDKLYRFEGYRLWQFKDETGSNPTLLATYDKKASIPPSKYDIGEIRDYISAFVFVNGSPVPTEPYVAGANTGLRRFVKITKDAFTNGPLFNGNPYYFAVTAYGYSRWSDPPVLESTPRIIEVRPGKPAIDENIPYKVGDRIDLTQISGRGDGNVQLQVVDPYKLTGHDYKVIINNPLDTAVVGGNYTLRDPNTSYTLIDLTTNEVLFENEKDFLTSEIVKLEFEIPPSSLVGKIVKDGFILLVHQTAIDSIDWIDEAIGGNAVGVKGVYEIAGPGGTPVDKKSVFEELNSTGEWNVVVSDTTPVSATKHLDAKQNLNYTGGIALGFQDYEMRFNETGSQYYYFLGTSWATSPKAVGTVPFEVWEVGNNVDQTPNRLYVKINDLDGDQQWSYIDSLSAWEPIYAYRPNVPYMEEIPATAPSAPATQRSLGRLVFQGGRPANGSVVMVESWQPLSEGDTFEGKAVAPSLGDVTVGQGNLDEISVFPNPYFGSNNLERDKYQRFMRFTNLPIQASIRIFSLGGVFITKLNKDPGSQYVDWNLRNQDGLPVASGMYIAYIEMPGIGSKVMKLAVIMETQYIDRL